MTTGSTGYGAALTQTLRTTAAAYGFTLAGATTLAILTSVHGTPHEGDLFLFVAGALAAFATLEMGVLSRQSADDNEGKAFPFAGVLNCFSVPAALGSSIAVAHLVHGQIAWLIAPFLATAIYLLVVALQVRVVSAVRSA